MCGLFGYSGKDPVDILRLTFLAAENEARGDDATGVYGNFLSKSTKKAKEFVVTKDFRTAVQGATNIIGHTRKATVGYKIQANAHPFEVTEGKGDDAKTVVGTHNGQVFSQCLEILQKKYDLSKTDVDSEFIYKFMLFNKFDYDKTLSELEGMMALAFIRPEFPEHLYLYHRESRPLSVGFINGNMYYSSESGPLDLIGCQSIEPLETDKLYIFKNGGLLEVSPVKKPKILVNIVDQGATTWLANATAADKLVLGISGADAKKTTNANESPSNQKYLPFTGVSVGNGTDGGQSNSFPRSRVGELSLLAQVPTGLYTAEQDIKPPKVGRYYDCGNNNSAYVFAFLHNSTDDSIGLPAWYVRVAGRPDINAVSTHNGIIALEIPSTMCGKPIKLEMFNPLQQHVIYKVVINKPETGKVLEVALSIPFRCTEKEQKGSEDPKDFLSIHFKSSDTPEGQPNTLCTFPKFFNAFKGSEQLLQRIQSRWIDSVPRRCEDTDSTTSLQGDNGELPNISIQHGAHRAAFTSGNLEDTFDPKTDILTDMNYYTVVTNLTELTAHKVKIEDLLSQPDPDMRDMKEALARVQNYLNYEEGYLSSRAKFHEEEEMKELASNRYVTHDYAVTE